MLDQQYTFLAQKIKEKKVKAALTSRMVRGKTGVNKAGQFSENTSKENKSIERKSVRSGVKP